MGYSPQGGQESDRTEDFTSLLQEPMLCVVTQSFLTLCDPMDCSPPGSSVCGISQARILPWVAMPFSRGISHPGIELESPAPVGIFSTTEPSGKPLVLRRNNK